MAVAAHAGVSATNLAFATADLPPAKRFNAWRDVLSPLFDIVPDPAIPTRQFYGRAESYAIGRLTVFEAAFSSQWAKHWPWGINDHDEVPLLLLCCDEGGYQGHNGWQPVQAGSGDVGLFDLRQSLDVHIASSRILMLLIPRQLLTRPGARASLLSPGLVHRRDTLCGSILHDLLQTTWQQVKSGLCTDGGVIESMLIANLEGAFAHAPVDPEGDLSPAQQRLFENIQIYVEAHLEDDLGVSQLSRRFSCSRSRIYRLFESYGGVSRYVRHARLHRCLEALSGLHGPVPSITELGIRFQFTDSSHFSHQFRETFGVTPSQVSDVA